MDTLIGKKAPVFEAQAVVNGGEIVEEYTLEQFIGEKYVVFFFYPADFTFVCPTELIAFQRKIKEFEKSFELRSELHELFLTSLMKSRHGYLTGHPENAAYYSSIPVLVKGKVKEIQGYALKKNVETALAFKGSCLEEGQDYEIHCPEAETLVLNCVLFPLYPSLGKRNSELIARILSTLP